jgi:hypothetical protein
MDSAGGHTGPEDDLGGRLAKVQRIQYTGSGKPLIALALGPGFAKLWTGARN